jgi:hypothetical protein
VEERAAALAEVHPAGFAGQKERSGHLAAVVAHGQLLAGSDGREVDAGQTLFGLCLLAWAGTTAKSLSGYAGLVLDHQTPQQRHCLADVPVRLRTVRHSPSPVASRNRPCW